MFNLLYIFILVYFGFLNFIVKYISAYFKYLDVTLPNF